MHTYTHITSSPLYTSTLHTIERLSRSSWQITSPLLSAPIMARTYAEAKALAAEIDFNALSAKTAEVEPPQEDVKKMPLGQSSCAGVAKDQHDETASAQEDVKKMPFIESSCNPFEAILDEAAKITDLGTMQSAYDQAVKECDLCAVMGHLSGSSLGDVLGGRFRLAVEAARAIVPDYARVSELAGMLVGEDSMLWARVAGDTKHLVDGAILPLPLIESLCDLPDSARYITRALILWACAVGLDGEASWVARLRLEGAALRHACEVAFMAECERADREWKEPKNAQEVKDSARVWADVWDAAMSYDASARAGAKTFGDAARVHGEVVSRVGGLLPSLLSPEPEHWIPLSDDGRVLIVNWRAGECVREVISAAVWLDDGGLSLLGSYVLGSGWVSVDRLREDDVDAEALGVILEAIASAGLATIA